MRPPFYFYMFFLMIEFTVDNLQLYSLLLELGTG